LEPTLAALQAKKDIALANKETLVAAGELVMERARENGCAILPVDSEHSAVFQCLEEERESVAKIILTASGGPFLHRPLEQMRSITPAEALAHPNWRMGAKITVDSATMMNKGLEVIEAHHLFALGYDQIEVLIHPQSLIHSLVEYRDTSVLAQLGRPDMRIPIQYALDYPLRHASAWERLDLRGKTLTFLEPEQERFPALAVAYAAGRRGGTMPAVMNAANEVAVEAFLKGEISFPDILRLVIEVCEAHTVRDHPGLEEILAADDWARRRVLEFMEPRGKSGAGEGER
jgi:1-deoxy-D-xylulose-5-phosphate reductoisomerase